MADQHVPASFCPRAPREAPVPYQCDACAQDVHCFGPRCACCNREPEREEIVLPDTGGWVSGPCISTEPVRAADGALERARLGSVDTYFDRCVAAQNAARQGASRRP